MPPLSTVSIPMQKLTVLNPRVADAAVAARLAPQLASLQGAKIGFIDNSKVNADIFLSHVAPILKARYGAETGIVVRKLAPKDELSEAELARLAECHAVIQC